ncbi:ABC transporter involved in cytochrome c biogenesis2C CcmB subunit [gamma proteobacterium IMCC2047]|nr:ABC transporter involved in cytochrome c biogenesis2C CcmB subunit [gamma proteobacterium IMCC2047]
MKQVNVKQVNQGIFIAMIRRDMTAAFRHPSDLINPLIFFVVVVTLFPLAVTPESDFLREIAPGVLWVSALLATLLSLDMLFQSDFQDGTLEQMILSPQPLYASILAKVFTHWLLSGLPLTLLSPLLAMMLFLSADGTQVLMLTLLLGTPVLSFIGAIGSALTVGLRKTGLLLSLLVLPLYIPVLIFASGAVQAAIAGLPIVGHLALLGALLALAVVLAPVAIATALRISLSG